MKLGLGIYARMLTRDNLRFARQIGAEAVVVHMTDYTPDGPTHSHFDADAGGRDVTDSQGRLWTTDNLTGLRELVESEGLELAALENLNPAFWYDVILGGPRRDEQLANVCEIIRRMGAARIPCLGYYFSMAGVWGRTEGPYARAGANSMAYSMAEVADSAPLPAGWVANRIYDRTRVGESLEVPTEDELRERHRHFLSVVLPIAEEHGVKLAMHPDDPPVPVLRGTPRLMYRADLIKQSLINFPSKANVLELCVGTMAEMPETDLYAVVDEVSAEQRIGYVHFRNVKGSIPNYAEVFVDEGDIDMLRILRILHKNNYEGVLIPDHTPFPLCDAPWHTGMAFALGYMRAGLRSLEAAA